MPRRMPLPLVLLLVANGAAGQSLAWDVPPRGALVYERTTRELRVVPPPGRNDPSWVIAGAESGGHVWRHAAGPKGFAPADFMLPEFDDSAWASGRGRFGADPDDATQRTVWAGAQICLRARVDVGRVRPRLALFRVDHDDGVRIWCNGHLLVSDDGYGRNRLYAVEGGLLDAIQRGENLFAVQCTDVGGARYLDVALALFPSLPPGIKTGPDLVRSLQETERAAADVGAWFFGGFRPAPMLLHGELTQAGDRVRMPPGDLRELGWFAATNLERGVTGGAIAIDVLRLYRVGDLTLKGRFDAVDADGWQRGELQVRTLPEPAPGDDSKRFVARYVRPFANHGIDGRLTLRRRLELRPGGRARITEFEFELVAEVQQDKDRKAVVGLLRHAEHWRLQREHHGQDAGFRVAVAKAIERGTAHLRALLQNPQQGDLKDHQRQDQSYSGGRLAIGCLALIKGGVPKDDAVLAAALADLRRRELVDTYSLGNALMALEALHAPANEFGDLKSGAIDRPRRRTVPPDDLAIVQGWTDRLLSNVDTRVESAYVLRFNYTGGPRYDHSVNQYGLLGLYSAHLCGARLPGTTWEAAANHLIASQGPGRGRIDLDLTDYRSFARMQADPEAQRTIVRLPVAPAGWNYEDPKDAGEETPQFGSMTCAGITGLTICEAGILDNPAQKRGRLLSDIAVARNAGFGWLAQHLQVRYHPGWIQRQQHWIYYYLYGLERAALLSGVALIQDRDWYLEGALQLVLTQHDNGSWPGELHWDLGIERTAMAILFLKQSTLPVLTGR